MVPLEDREKGHMKKMLVLLPIGILIVICIIFAILSIISRKPPETGMINGRLRPCPGTPNCVCSETPESPFYIEPLDVESAPQEAWTRLKSLVKSLGGRIEIEEEGYLWAVFFTKLFLFRDDVELRLDTDEGLIHIRSSSRVGYSDLGQNRKRVNIIQEAFKKGDIGR